MGYTGQQLAGECHALQLKQSFFRNTLNLTLLLNSAYFYLAIALYRGSIYMLYIERETLQTVKFPYLLHINIPSPSHSFANFEISLAPRNVVLVHHPFLFVSTSPQAASGSNNSIIYSSNSALVQANSLLQLQISKEAPIIPIVTAMGRCPCKLGGSLNSGQCHCLD